MQIRKIGGYAVLPERHGVRDKELINEALWTSIRPFKTRYVIYRRKLMNNTYVVR